MTHDARAIANYFLRLAKKSRRGLDPMQINKLVYLAHGWHLALTDEPLIDEPVEAWKFGPVIPSVYHAFKHYGKNKITAPASRLDLSDFSLRSIEPKVPDCQREILNKVWDTYGKFEAFQLSGLTHRDGTPWDKVWNEEGGCRELHAIIPDDKIRQ